MTVRAGSCLCGKIRYILHGEPVAVAICHCTDCQKQSGSAFSVIAAVSESAYEQSGKTTNFAAKGDSGEAVSREFCGTCGSPIVARLAIQPGMVIVKIGTLDDATGLIPQAEVYTHRAADWLPALAAVRFPGRPEGGSP